MKPSGHSHKPTRNKKDSLYVRQEKMWVRVPTSEILYIKADDNDVIINTSDKAYKSHTKLSDVYESLPRKDFLQVHRSYIVQLHKIDKINGEAIEINNTIIPVSKAHIKELRNNLNIL
jgi:DNA-binding LytR/AlgR family response regulator